MGMWKGFKSETRKVFSLTPEEKTYTKKLRAFVKKKTHKIPKTKKQFKKLSSQINFRNYFG